jgi:hypothetical protein
VPLPGGGDDGGGSTNSPDGISYSFSTNGLWLGIASGQVVLDARYFYYVGHGNSYLIGGGYGYPNPFGGGYPGPFWYNWPPGGNSFSPFLWMSEVSSALGNYVHRSIGGQVYPVYLHPYRFVFLNGCKTGAAGAPWAAAFGIGLPFNGTDWPAEDKRAFVGWNKEIQFGTANDFAIAFFGDWTTLNGQGKADIPLLSAISVGCAANGVGLPTANLTVVGDSDLTIDPCSKMRRILIVLLISVGIRASAEVQRSPADVFFDDCAVPQMTKFIRQHRIAFNTQFLRSATNRFKYLSSVPVAIVGESNLNFSIIRWQDGTQGVNWFHDETECIINSLQVPQNIPLMRNLAAKTNLLTLHSALELAKFHLEAEGFNPLDFHPPTIHQLDWGWKHSKDYILLPYYTVRWVVKYDNDDGSHVAPEVVIDVSGISSNMIQLQKILSLEDLKRLHAR